MAYFKRYLNYEELKEEFQIISFSLLKKDYADFLIRLQYYKLSKTKFLRWMIVGLLEKDPDLMKYLDKIRDNNFTQYSIYGRYDKPSQGTKQRNKIKTQDKREKKIDDLFNLNEEDVSEFYDILEKDLPSDE